MNRLSIKAPHYLAVARRIGLFLWLGCAVFMLLSIASRHFGNESLSNALKIGMWVCGCAFFATVVFSIFSIAAILVKALARGLKRG